ncbi:hypothetical protein BH11MYX1_BH11MYX1_19230 [soil metagenome]
MSWVLEIERAYVEAATTRVPLVQDRSDRFIAATGAVASHFLAVGSPRSFSLIVDDDAQLALAQLSLEAHRTWFKPTDLRCTSAAVAADVGGRVVPLAEALAVDIVCVHGASVKIAAAQLRRGTHVNLLGAPNCADAELLQLATVVDTAGLCQMAAGFVDGRQLDELTLFRRT